MYQSIAVTLLLLAAYPLSAQFSARTTGKAAAELPLKASETIEFTVDEGTWISLDVSPDGKTIVFDLLGDLYTLPITGGQAHRIVGGMSFESQPKFSPDGKTIAFVSDRDGGNNIWFCDPDGSHPRALTKGRHASFLSPAWTSDGQYILAVDRQGGTKVTIFHKDGGTGVSLPPTTSAPSATGRGPAPVPARPMGPIDSPDGRYFFYAKMTGREVLPGGQIVREDRRTGEIVTVTDAQGSAMRPVLSPDGRFLVYATRMDARTALRVHDLRTEEERWLAYPATRDEQDSLVASRDLFPGYAFTPDGKSVVLAIDGKISRVDFLSGKAEPIPFTADVRVETIPRLHYTHRVDDGPTVRGHIVRWPKLSPDGRRMTFSSLNKVWVMDLPNGKPKRLTSQDTAGENMPTWSRDGRNIVYVSWNNRNGDIWRIPADGGVPKKLTNFSAYYTNPVYSPDGSKIVFVVGSAREHMLGTISEPQAASDAEGDELIGIKPSSDYHIGWIPAEGGEPQRIGPVTETGPSAFLERIELSPHFGNDSGRIYWAVNNELHSMRLDGSERRTELSVRDARDLKISPDGHRVFVEVRHQSYLITGIPDVGRQVLALTVNDEGRNALPVRKISLDGGDFLQWSQDGNSLTWGIGTTFFYQPISAAAPLAVEPVVEGTRHKPSGVVVLSGAMIITMRGDEVLPRGDIVVAGNRIAAVGPKGSVGIPAGARVIDVSGKVIVPGFIDNHAHMRPPFDVYTTQSWMHMAALAYGVTTARDPQAHTHDLFAYLDLLDTGEMLGPREFTTGPAVLATSTDDTEATIRNFVRRYKDFYHTTMLKEYVTGDRLTRQWVALACKEFELTPTTEGSSDMVLDLTQIIDGYSGNEHNLPIVPLYKDVVELLARTHTFYTPAMMVSYGSPRTEDYYFENQNPHDDPKLRRFVPHEILDSLVRRRSQWFHPDEYATKSIAKGLADVVHAGGHVCLGSHGEMQGLGVHWELWSMQSGGLTNMETLRAATLCGAEAMGYEQDLGSLEPGKFADLLVLDRDPLVDIHNTSTIRYVMRNGEVYIGETLDRIWPSEQKLTTPWWAN